jgi:histidyl-tRNA synthetase
MKPSVPKGTRDFTPQAMAGRNYIFDTAKKAFHAFGFQQIETPAMENLSTLTGKYGDEGDQLMFKVLERGDKFKKAVAKASEESKESDFASQALRYDLTVPFARFVTQHQNEIGLPFKRFQIQPVWRADRPQKGRYREFYQCDVDIVGSESLWSEVELVQIYHQVLSELKIPGFKIKINNRKILSGIAEVVDAADFIVDITVAIDKLDKIGLEKVNEEMAEKGVSTSAIEKLQPILKLSGDTDEKLNQIEKVLGSSEIGIKGVEELRFIFAQLDTLGLMKDVALDLTLARGLNYYTGAIFEVECEGFKGSIGGGGRYDGLTDLFGLKGVAGVGVSFGADRIYDVLEENDLFPKDVNALDVMVVNFGEKEVAYILDTMKEIRSKGLSCELYPDDAKMKKQMNYANKRNARFVLMAGSEEMLKSTVVLKNMVTGAQAEVDKKLISSSID